MRLIKRILQRQDVRPFLPPPEVPGHDRNEVQYLRAFDKELRVRALDLEAEVLGRFHQRE